MRSPHPLLYPHALPPRARPVPPPPSSPSVQLLSLLIRANELGARVRLYPLAMSDAAGEAPLTVTVRHYVRTDHPCLPHAAWMACGIDHCVLQRCGACRLLQYAPLAATADRRRRHFGLRTARYRQP